MLAQDFIIREINPEDNAQIAVVIREVILEMGAPKVGTAYEDKATDQMYETYQKSKATYYVLEYDNKIVGGAGIAQLDNFDGNTCELQKMYFLPVTRGKGIGSRLMSSCIDRAKEYGYLHCYLETMPYMDAARSLYRKTGFVDLEKPLGNTGHYSCSRWMIKEL